MGSATKTVSYRYDAARNRTLMIDPEGGRTTYAYDSLDRLIGLVNPQGERTTYAYDANGRRTVKELANGTRASFTYDAANRLTTLANLRSDNTVISKFDYKYDNVGNRTEVVEADGSRVTWSYDPTYQLTAEHRTGSVPYRNTFTYDSVGNRLLKNESGARTTYSYDAANQLKTSIDAGGITTFTFDANGNQHLIQAPTGDRTTTVWDYENKATLVELPSGIRNTMAYEPDGLRVKLEESTGTKKFIWDHQNYLAESDENDDINVLYTNEPNTYGNLISQHRKSGPLWTPSYYHYGALGSTRQLTNNAEAITDQYLYDAWGNVISSSGSTPNPFQFTGNVGYYFDIDTATQYIRARIYSPLIGRWLSIDPLGFVDGMNLYVPYFVPNFVDPTGAVTVSANAFIGGWRGDWLYEPFSNRQVQFSSDHRGFGESGTSRLSSTVSIAGCSVGFVDPTVENGVGKSHRREIQFGFPNLGNSFWKHTEDTAVLEEKEFGWHGDCVSKSVTHLAASYPFRRLAPQINMTLVTVFEAGANVIDVTAVLIHDGFPDFEILINGNLAIKYTTPYDGPGLWSLWLSGQRTSIARARVRELTNCECGGSCEDA